MSYTVNRVIKSVLVMLLIAGSAMTFTASAVESVKHHAPADYPTITRQEVLWMYTMRTRFWSNGTKVTVVYRDFSSKVHRDFCNEVLGVTTDRFAQNVDTFINKGSAAYFIQANSEAEMYLRVSDTIGAIGYLSNDTVLINNSGTVTKFRIK
jgi:ABC-type phosphate transport system substrate-binding protein